MKASETLRGYSHLIALSRELRTANINNHDAVSLAVDQCIQDGMLVEYLTKHRAEVIGMLYTMEDEERAQRVHRETIAREAREEGFAMGLELSQKQGIEQSIERGRQRGIELEATASVQALTKTMGVTAREAMDLLQISEERRPAIEARLATI